MQTQDNHAGSKKWYFTFEICWNWILDSHHLINILFIYIIIFQQNSESLFWSDVKFCKTITFTKAVEGMSLSAGMPSGIDIL